AAQCQVVLPPAVTGFETSSPFAITSLPAGTLTVKSNVALSRGVSFTGYQPGEPCGSLTTKAPSSVGTQPSIDSSGSVIGSGWPEDFTLTLKRSPRLSFGLGVITSSCSAC